MKQNEISHIYLQGSDLAEREETVLADAVKKTGFKPGNIFSRSNWWRSKEIGAFFVSGQYLGEKAVLKIQGVKSVASEASMIENFKRTNKSRLIRPPKIYASIKWDSKKRYEALILEPVEESVVNIPTNQDELNLFFNAYEDYRENCINQPWVKKPTESIAKRVETNFLAWRKATCRLYPTHPLRREDDLKIINKAVETLKKGYRGIKFEFQHAHFSQGDLYVKGNQIIILSNLYWAFRPPLYDAVFGQHWFIYHLANLNIEPEVVDEQKKLWMERIFNLPVVKEKGEKLLKLAFLERAAAGLNLDALTVNPDSKTAEYVIEETRKEVKKLIKELA